MTSLRCRMGFHAFEPLPASGDAAWDWRVGGIQLGAEKCARCGHQRVVVEVGG